MLCRPFVKTMFFFATFVAAGGMCSAQAPVEVLYAQENSTLLTYDVDVNTLQATPAGEPLTLAGKAEFVQVIPSPNGHYLYILSAAQSGQEYLSVYATDAMGVPQSPVVQTLGPLSIQEFTIDPNGRFAYATEVSSTSQRHETVLFTIDASTGKLTASPQVQGKYPPSEYCGPGFAGFYPNGSQIDVTYSCNYQDSYSVNYYSRSVDANTGALGPVFPIFGFNDNDGPSIIDEVRLAPRTVNNYHVDFSGTSIRIYPLVANTKTPIIDCTLDMLAVCGQATGFVQDSSGEYLAVSLSSSFEIVRIDLAQKQIIDTGSSFTTLQQPYFSPDDRIMYGISYQYNGPSTVQIYGFNPSNGALTPGGEFTLPATLWNVFVAERQ